MDTDSESADDAVDDQLGEVCAHGAADGRDAEHEGGNEHGLFPSEEVAQDAGDGNAQDGPDEGAAHVPPFRHFAEGELVGDDPGRSGDDGGVVSEQDAAEGRHRSDEQHPSGGHFFTHNPKYSL